MEKKHQIQKNTFPMKIKQIRVKKMEYFVDTSILKGNLNEVKWKFKG